MSAPVKDDGEHERPIPEVWRPALAAIVESMARGDAAVAAHLPEVSADPEFPEDCRTAVEEYGDVTLIPLPEEAWETSVCQWREDHWGCLIDLWTEEEGPSDLVLDLTVVEYGLGYRYKPHLVYVP